jgi:hypothetical protein
MVKLEEVLDEELVGDQQGPMGGEDDWDTDSGMRSISPRTSIINEFRYNEIAQDTLQMPSTPLHLNPH